MSRPTTFANLTGAAIRCFRSPASETAVDILAVAAAATYRHTAPSTEIVYAGPIPIATAPRVPRAKSFSGLPPVAHGTVYIVAPDVAVAAYAMGRRDVMAPGPARMTDGAEVGVEGLVYPGTSEELREVLYG